jgi:hypothetical protein
VRMDAAGWLVGFLLFAVLLQRSSRTVAGLGYSNSAVLLRYYTAVDSTLLERSIVVVHTGSTASSSR